MAATSALFIFSFDLNLHALEEATVILTLSDRLTLFDWLEGADF